jgi:redox-sensing transcriptional repressor
MMMRFSRYLRILEGALAAGVDKMSSRGLAELLGVTDSQVRKDFEVFGRIGRPGVGYRCEDLIEGIRGILGLKQLWPVALVGCGNLGQALIGYQGFRARGFAIEAAFDQNHQLVGKRIGGLTIQHIDQLPDAVAVRNLRLAILAVPAERAQLTAEIVSKAGICGILNFAPAPLNLPPTTSVSHVDLTIELEQLVFAVVQNQDFG